MNFVITEKRDYDRYVIYDMDNKGSACVSKYTINQLLKEHIVIGVVYRFDDYDEIIIEEIKPMTKDGTKPLKRVVRNSFVPDTKRSYATVSKGLFPSRAEKKALNEKAKKTKATKKANKKEQKLAEETRIKDEKEKKELKKKRKEELRVVKKRIQKSKPQFYFQKQEIIASEYNDSSTYHYKVECRTPSALSIFNKIIKSSSCFADTSNAGKIIKRGGIFSTTVSTNWPLDDETKIQLFADKTIWVDFDGSWENRCEILFEEWNNYKPVFTYTHGTEFNDNTYFGADSYCDYSAKGFAKYFRKRLGRPER